MDNFFTIATPVIYWILIVIWTYILIFYIRKIKSIIISDKLLKILLIVLAIDAFRTVIESIYFGAWYTSLSELIPIEIFNYLAQPQIVIIPKLINLIAAVLIFTILIKKWIHSEIEQKKKTADSLRKSEEKHKTILKSAIDGFWITDGNGKLLEVNDSYCQISGYSKDELLSMSIYDLDLGHSKEEITNRINKIRKHGSDRFESIHRRKDKTTYPVKINIQHQTIEREQFIVFIEDISERKIAQQKLEEREILLKTAELISDQGSWKWDIINDRWQFSENWLKIHGCKLSGIPKKELMKLAHPDDVEYINRAFEDALNDVKSYNIEHRIIRESDGEIRNIHSSAQVFSDKNGRKTHMIGIARDITESKLAEEMIKQSEAILRDAQRIAKIGNWSMDLQTGKVEISDEMLNITGLKEKDEALDVSNYEKLYTPESWQRYNEAVETIVKEGKSVEIELEFSDKDAKCQYAISRGEPIFDKNNKVIAIKGTLQDISYRKKAELELISKNKEYEDVNKELKRINQELKEAKEKAEEGEEKFKTLFEDSNTIQLLINPETGIIVDANQSACEYYGYTYKELTALKIQDINQYSSEKVKQEMLSAKMKERNYFEFQHKLNDGTIRDVEVYSNPIFIDNVTHLLSIVHDITLRKKAERELIKAKEEINNSLQQINIINSNTPNIIWKWDIGEDTNYNNVYISKGVDEFLALAKGTIGNSIDKFFSYILPEYIPLIQELIEDRIKNINEPVTVEYEVKKADGNIAWFSSTGKVVSENNRLTIYGTTIDITEKKHTELELIKAKVKAEESDKLKSAFLANMSHEIRTPMNGIIGFTELLKNPDLSGDKRDKFIQIIRKSGQRMLNTVNDIIDISKVDAGQVEISNSTIYINEELENLFQFFNAEASAKGIEIKLINKLPKKSFILTDKTKFSSIITNLIKNAIKYTDKGSIEIECQKNEDHLNIWVRDTGIGIPEKRIKSIFNRFEQADIDDIHAREGSGLGLAIIKAYIDLLGGSISVESEEGKGSTFYLSLPWIQEQEKHKPKLKKEDDSVYNTVSKLNILVAEDDDTSFQYLEIILDSISNKIIRTKNGKETIDIMKKNSDIDLILMDLKMPIMDGYEASEEIRKFNKDVLIIAQTAYALEGDKENSMAAGCNDYISKPINGKLLLELINKHNINK